MEYIRIVHPKNISEIDGRPSNIVFKNSKNDTGISCIKTQCAIDKSGTVCQHIPTYYSEPISGDPVIFWPVPDSLLSAYPNCEWVQKDSEMPGKPPDTCHHNLKNLGNSTADRIIRSQPIDAFTICDGNSTRPLQLSDIQASRQRYALIPQPQQPTANANTKIEQLHETPSENNGSKTI